MDIPKKISDLGLQRGHYIVIGSGVMGALNLRPINDIDLVVNPNKYAELKNRDCVEKVHDDETRELLFGVYGIKTSWDSPNSGDNLQELLSDSIEIEGVAYISPQRLLRWKKRMKRAKDKKDILFLEKFLNTQQDRFTEKPTLYIMCGLPFAGKSRLAKELSENRGWKVVAVDEIKTKRGLRDVWQDMKPEDWTDIFAEAERQTERELLGGRSVIYDSTNHTKHSRDKLRELAKRCHCSAKLILVDVSPDVAEFRWKANKESGERMDLPEWAFRTALGDWEPPVGDEQD